jgi:hypothetical protein
MTGNARGNARGSRGAFGANIVIAVALIALVAAVALVVKPPSPPGTAEFAPEAAKAITKAPQQQAGAFGANGACSAGATCTGAQKKVAAARAHAAAVAQAAKKPAVASATSATYTGVPPQLQCVQWPDGAVTQDFDPQSPPCVSDWPGQAKGNGGSTATGVTGSTITVAAENFYATTDAGNAAIVNFFNSHFELYGRHFVLTYPNTSSDDTFTPTGQQAAAATYAASKPFASTDLVSTQGQDVEFLNYLAQAHIVTVAPTVQEPASELASLSPYLYTYQPALDQIESNLAAMICTSLPASGNAVYGGATVATKKRKFAIVEPDSTPVSQYDQPSGAATVNTSQTELLANLEREGVTSVILFGSADEAALVMRSAAGINYTPEWISSGVGDLGSEEADASFSENAPSSESEYLIGMTPASKYLPYAEMPWSQAYADEGITTPVDYGYSDFYHEMLILASGVQAAGPDLTPQTFATGLRGLQFPNPGADQAPSYQAKVDFGSGSTMTQDYAAWYFSPTTDSNASNNATYVGASCDINLGERWSLGSWPANLSFSGVGKSCY